MTRELRRRHRMATLALALLLPAAYVAALAARAPSPVAASSLAAPLGEPSLVATGARVTLPSGVTLARDADGARVVELDSRGLGAQPDALAYWSAEPPRGESLPPDVFFLGALAEDGARAWRLPEPAQAGGGNLLVFSVAWQRVTFAASLAPEAAR